MDVIPAIDLLEGNVVRLEEGKRSSAKVYSKDPLLQLEKFAGEGASIVHVVDLDAAFGTGNNRRIIGMLAATAKTRGVALEVGGGIRSLDDAKELVGCGAARLVLGTVATDEKKLGEFVCAFGKKIWIALDMDDGAVMVKGWTQSAGIGLDKMLDRIARSGVGGVIITDISKDGMLGGISGGFYTKIKKSAKFPIVASGGVAGIDDIAKLKEAGVDGVIIGKAYYEGKIGLKDAIEAAREN
ncbi:1-(5-phosphoribosyl)-5-[(5-phosphoribosylamino)methylideneamino] imidazole-4-carboxamide isomerase [Candidatus Parvarchaeota archaeon]|nr:1-(5-phosphoribosyl)-5-[(5-phosphoribosylamino)methylideneamino] imidazole-4-carboxamide isomerase [Candidatus Parvarchaeota archaeon]